MPHTRKLPDFDLLSAHYLRRGLQKHPDIGDHVADIKRVEDMQLWQLMDLTQKMGIDAHALIIATEQNEDKVRRFSDMHPAFDGEIEFDVTIEAFGKRVVRKVRAEYTLTPEWPYFDLVKGEVSEGWPGSSMRVQFRTVPEEDNVLGDPTWEDIDITSIGQVWNVIEEAIEERCKVEDAKRRKVAASKPSRSLQAPP
jgi:hypothetical protein